MLKTFGHSNPLLVVPHTSVEEGYATGYDIYVNDAPAKEKLVKVKQLLGKK